MAREKDLRDGDRVPEGRKLSDSTSDLGMISARIFVGSISGSITREKLQHHFSTWGKVKGVSLTKNKFGFVQFETEAEAQNCLASGYTTLLDGIKLDVKPAKIGPTSGDKKSMETGGGRGRDIRDRGERDGGGRSRDGDRGGGGYRGDRDRSPLRREDDYYNSYYRHDKSRDHKYPPRHSYDSGWGDYYDRYYDKKSARDLDYYTPRESMHIGGRDRMGGTPQPIDPLDPSRPNDCEIVVPNKSQRAYAESIEAQLKQIGLMVDLLYPPVDLTPVRVLSDLSVQNCLYAIFVTEENEKHNSLTLNILHGESQEHRNMPVEDALNLILQNFEDYVKKCRRRNKREIVPRDVHNLLLDLIETRPLSMGDLDKLIKYLRERQNSLVDDQIEQKRETAGNPSRSSVAVTYPGYNYIATTIAGAATGVGASSSQPSGALGGPTAQIPMSLGIMSAAPPNAAAAQPAPATYPVAAAAAAAAVGVQSGMMSMWPPAGIGAAAGGGMVAQAQPGKQAELQDRLMMMKAQSGSGGAGIPPTGVPAPSAVPAPGPPTGVPAPASCIIPPQQQNIWMQSQQPTKSDTVVPKIYNPWTQ